MRNTMMLIPRLLHCRSELIFSQINCSIRNLKTSRKPSTIMSCLSLIQQLNIVTTPSALKTSEYFPSALPNSSLINTLLKYPKYSTSSNEYKQMFNAVLESLNDDWNVYYTDGSKSNTSTTFAVTNQLGGTIMVGSMPSYCSVFTAEAAAIFKAVQFASRMGNKCIICTDSRSAIEAIFNTNNEPLISNIRSMLLQSSNCIKIMWVPSHIGIHGIEIADKKAKEASKQPLHFFDYFTDKDIRRLVETYVNEIQVREWSNHDHHYKKFNPAGTKPLYPGKGTCKNIRTFIRLRIGHTTATHAHILNGVNKPNCMFCGSNDVTVIHLLDTCPALQRIRANVFSNKKPSLYLERTDDSNIEMIAKYISLCKLNI
uniref:RNase H type-1 domain-containing protein n=1 Tax=Bactrocera latifrons TaxID=174628 RepID=A0A0K8VQJ3_BACLA